MKKVYLVGLALILSLVLFGCNDTDDNIEDKNEGITEEQDDVEDTDEPITEVDEMDAKDSDMTLHTGSTETVSRAVEGMDQDVEVVNYDIEDYNISYQLDEEYGAPEVVDNEINYSIQEDEYKISLEVIENTSLEEAVPNVQEKFEAEAYEDKGELEDTVLEENDLKGQMQYFTYPDLKGFYAYEMDEHVFLITYEYPVEAGDGLQPLLEDLRKSIKVE